MQVKKGLEEEFKKIQDSTTDDYGKAILAAMEAVGTALDEGKEVAEAHDQMFGKELTGFMAGVAAALIHRFNPRGDEFKKFFNELFGADSENVVNPAIVTIDTEEK